MITIVTLLLLPSCKEDEEVKIYHGTYIDGKWKSTYVLYGTETRNEYADIQLMITENPKTLSGTFTAINAPNDTIWNPEGSWIYTSDTGVDIMFSNNILGAMDASLSAIYESARSHLQCGRNLLKQKTNKPATATH